MDELLGNHMCSIQTFDHRIVKFHLFLNVWNLDLLEIRVQIMLAFFFHWKYEMKMVSVLYRYQHSDNIYWNNFKAVF